MLPTVSSGKNTGDGVSYYKRQEMIKQQKPYDLLLNYSSFTLTRVGPRNAGSNYDSQYSAWWLQAVSGDLYEGFWDGLRVQARNAALKRYNSSKGQAAAMGVALAESRKTLDMVTERVVQLVKAGNALRKGRFLEVAETLGLTRKVKPPKKLRTRKGRLKWTKHPIKGVWYPYPKAKVSSLRRKPHQFADLWLEYSFGWGPTVSDISTSLKVLEAPIHYQSRLSGQGRATGGFKRSSQVRTMMYDAPDPVYGWDYPVRGYTNYDCDQSGEISCVMRGVITVTNPNRDLATRLGLTNLPAIALELVPFSFVLNWFVNLEEYFGQFSEDYGVTVAKLCYSDFAKCNSAYNVTRSDTRETVNGQKGTHEAISTQRTVGSLPGVVFGLRPEYHNGLSRALNQSSLLVKLFTSRK